MIVEYIYIRKHRRKRSCPNLRYYPDTCLMKLSKTTKNFSPRSRPSDRDFDTEYLMMEAARTSETSVDNYFTRQYIPEDNSERVNMSTLLKYKTISF